MMKGIASLGRKGSTSFFTVVSAAMLLGLIENMSMCFQLGFCVAEKKITMR